MVCSGEKVCRDGDTCIPMATQSDGKFCISSSDKRSLVKSLATSMLESFDKEPVPYHA